MTPQENLTQLKQTASLNTEVVRAALDGVLEAAGLLGLVVTVETKPNLPPAMGNYYYAISVRPSLENARALTRLEEAAAKEVK